MKKLKIFPKMFIQIFSVLSIIVLLIHISIYLIFPKTYLDTREAEINKTANEISYSLEGKNINDIKRAIELYSKNSDIKVFVSSEKKDNEVEVSNDLNINAQFKKIVALSNLIQRIYHNDIRNMLP